jgi:hypothetical protein
MISLKCCTIDTCGVRVLCEYLLQRFDYAMLCCYWYYPLLLFSTHLYNLHQITLQNSFDHTHNRLWAHER